MVLSIASAWQRRAKPPDEEREVIGKGALNETLFVLLATSIFVASIAFRLAPISVSTAVFFTFCAICLNGWNLRHLPIASSAGVVVGIFCEIMFTRVLVMDFPRF